MEEKYTNALKSNLSVVSPKVREQIFRQWENNIFPHNNDVKEYLQHLYKDCAKNYKCRKVILK